MDNDEEFAVRVLKNAASRGETFVVESEGGQYVARIHSDAMLSILSRIGDKPKPMTPDEAVKVLNEGMYGGTDSWVVDGSGPMIVVDSSMWLIPSHAAIAVAEKLLREKEAVDA